eukprot:scaffold69772_cov20-Prasinocladus_malaysianus.AAC.1
MLWFKAVENPIQILVRLASRFGAVTLLLLNFQCRYNDNYSNNSGDDIAQPATTTISEGASGGNFGVHIDYSSDRGNTWTNSKQIRFKIRKSCVGTNDGILQEFNPSESHGRGRICV